MVTVVATHAVGDMETWLDGGDTRKALFQGFCSSYRIFRHVDKAQVSLVFEGADVEKMRAALGSAEASKSKAAHTVIDPVEIYIEIDGGT